MIIYNCLYNSMLPVSFITSWAAPTNSLHSCPSTRHSSREILPSPQRNIKGFLMRFEGGPCAYDFPEKTGVVPRLGIYNEFAKISLKPFKKNGFQSTNHGDTSIMAQHFGSRTGEKGGKWLPMVFQTVGLNLSPCSYCLINPLRESQLRFGMNQWSRVHWYCAPPCDKSYSIHMLIAMIHKQEWWINISSPLFHCLSNCCCFDRTIHRCSRKTPSTSCLWMQFFTNSRFPTFQGQPITSPSGPSDITWTKAPPGSRYRKMACNRLVSSSPGTAKWRQHVASWRPWLWGVRTNTWPFNTSRK